MKQTSSRSCAPMDIRGGSHGPHRRWLVIALVLVSIGSVPNGHAVAGDGPIDEPAAFVVEPTEDAAIPRGKLAYLEGVASTAGAWLKVPALKVDQAVQIVLLSGDAAAPVTMELRKFHWTAPLRRASTDHEGRCTERLRTQGDLFIKVLSVQGEQPYRLLVWVDEQSVPTMTPALVPQTTKR